MKSGSAWLVWMVLIACGLLMKYHLLVPTAKPADPRASAKKTVVESVEVHPLGIKLLDIAHEQTDELRMVHGQTTYRYQIPEPIGVAVETPDYPRVTVKPVSDGEGSCLCMSIDDGRCQYVFLLPCQLRSRVEVYVGQELRAVYDSKFSWTETREVVAETPSPEASPKAKDAGWKWPCGHDLKQHAHRCVLLQTTP